MTATSSVPGRARRATCRPGFGGVVTRMLSFAAPSRVEAESQADVSTARWIGRAGAALFVLVSLVDALYAFTEPGRLLARRGAALRAQSAVPIGEQLPPVRVDHARADRARAADAGPRRAARLAGRRRAARPADADAEPLDSAADGRWTPQELWHKPGDPRRAPDFVAPHQPRVDFQLWFYGLAFRRREPTYVSTLVERMCEDPAAVQPLFRRPLPPHPAAVRIVYWRYVFASRAERRATGAWWSRARVAVSRAVTCSGGDR